MLSGFAARQISRANRNLLIVNVLLLGILGLILLACAPYIRECLRGPTPTDLADIIKLQSADDAPHAFVSFDLNPLNYDDMAYSVTGGSDHKNDYYHFLHVSRDSYLVILNSSKSGPTHVEGSLVPLSTDFRNSVLPDISGDVKGSALDVMVNTNNYRTGFYVLTIVGGLFGLLFLWNIAKAARRMSNPLNHPLARQLAAIGPVDEMAIALDAEMQAGATKVGKVVTTQSWLFRKALLGGTVVYLGDLAWAYQKSTQHRTNGIPTGTTYCMVTYDVRGKRNEFALSQKQVQTLLVDLANRVPWVVVGYSKELETVWTKNRADFLNNVAARKKQTTEAAPDAIAPSA